MLEPIQQPLWSKPERRAWGLALTLLLLTGLMALAAIWSGRSWTYQIGLEYIPKEISIKAYEIGSDLMDFSLTLPNYAIGEYFVLNQILPQSWIYLVVLVASLLAISLVGAGVSYFEGTWLYGMLGAFGLGISLATVEVFGPMGLGDKWVSAVALLLVVGPLYGIQGWLHHWNLARRWLVLAAWYFLLTALLVGDRSADSFLSLSVAQLWFPLLCGSLIFILINATDVLQGMLTLVTKEENSRQSWMHFTIFSALYLANFILLYLRNTGQFVLDIFYINPFVIQAITILVGLWILEQKVEICPDENGRSLGFSAVYVGLATVFLATVALGFATANDLIVEVLEDAITLLHFCMGVSFFFYVVINYFQLMQLGLRVHQVMFRPRYMPVSAIPVFGIAGVFIFLVNGSYFPYYQALSARQVLLADHAQYHGDLFLAENYLKNSLSFESRNQRTNLSMAGLCIQNGNPAQAQEFALKSLEKNPAIEAYLLTSQLYRQKNLPLYELLQLQEAHRQFPGSGQIINNLGVCFSETRFKDSARYYLAMASESSDAMLAGKANLGYFYLLNHLEKDGLPRPSPESDNAGDWGLLNNSLVLANIVGERSLLPAEVEGSFPKIPEAIQPFLLFHCYLNKAIARDSTGFGRLRGLENDTLKRYYGEALSLGRSMCQYRLGLTRTGLEALVRLYDSSTGNRLDLALLLGQLFYEQGSFNTASVYFRKAALLGMNQAYYWHALCLLDGGNGAAAATAFAEALEYMNPADKVRVSVLIDGLKSGRIFNAYQRSDPEKSAYIKANWNQLADKELIDLIYLISDKESKRFLWQYAFRRAYNESDARRGSSLYQFASQHYRKEKHWREILAEAKPLLLDLQGNRTALNRWMAENTAHVSYSFLKGRIAQLENKPADALGWYRKALEENPLSNRQAGLALSFISSKTDTRQEAYQAALDLTNLDPGNVEFLKLYALLSVKEGVPEFAFQVLPRIQNLSSAAAGDAFKARIEEEVAKKGFLPMRPN